MYKQKGKMSSFHQFHEEWYKQLHELIQQLNKSPRPAKTQEQHELHTQLVQKVTSHYYEYYRVKSMAAKDDILHIFTAPWSNSLEQSLCWIAGWRPTTAFHLIYTESSILFESHILDILRGLRNGDLGDLSPYQLSRFSEFQCEAVHQENEITEELSNWQDGAYDIIGTMGDITGNMEKLVGILKRADQLRLKTIENVLQNLTAQQAVEFLIAAAHLLFGIRGWGVNYDRQRAKG